MTPQEQKAFRDWFEHKAKTVEDLPSLEEAWQASRIELLADMKVMAESVCALSEANTRILESARGEIGDYSFSEVIHSVNISIDKAQEALRLWNEKYGEGK